MNRENKVGPMVSTKGPLEINDHDFKVRLVHVIVGLFCFVFSGNGLDRELDLGRIKISPEV